MQEVSCEARFQLPGRDVFAMNDRASEVVDELTNSTSKLNHTSRPFQAMNLE